MKVEWWDLCIGIGVCLLVNWDRMDARNHSFGIIMGWRMHA